MAPFLLRSLSPERPEPSRHLSVPVGARHGGTVRITGRLAAVPPDDLLVVMVHGLGGHAASPYMVRAARAARQLGISTLRLNLRGADGRGDDLYHGGLTRDFVALFASAAVSRFRRVALLGFSLGGHIVLAAAVREALPRLTAVASLCAPLHLEASATALDREVSFVYRAALLRYLKRSFRSLRTAGNTPAKDWRRCSRIRSIVEWDDRVIAPYFGFDGAHDYYHQVSVGPDLHRLPVPTLLVHTRRDPIVLFRSVEPWLPCTPRVTSLQLDHGGHVAFSRHTDLGQPGPRGIDRQVLQWLMSQAVPGR